MLQIRNYRWSQGFSDEELSIIQNAIEFHDTDERSIITRLCVVCSFQEMQLEDGDDCE